MTPDVPAPTEPDAIAHMTDVELETFARAVVAERDALAAALESARAEIAAQRMRAEVAEARCWAVRPGSRAGDIECCLRRGHDGDHWATTGCAGSEITWPRIEAERDAERAKVQAVEAALRTIDSDFVTAAILQRAYGSGTPDAVTEAAYRELADAVVAKVGIHLAPAIAALAAAQPTGKTPC